MRNLRLLEEENQALREKLGLQLDTEYKNQSGIEPILHKKMIQESNDKLEELFSHSEEEIGDASQKL